MELIVTLLYVAAAWWVFKYIRRRYKRTDSGLKLKPESNRRPPHGAHPAYHLRYTDGSGETTRRDIYPIPNTANPQAFDAWCYLRNDVRTFLFDRIVAVHDNKAGNDIGARGLLERLGLTPEPAREFGDEQPEAFKQSPWPESPTKARFRITYTPLGNTELTAEGTPVRWGSNRRTLCLHAIPGEHQVPIDFADIRRAIDLETGEVLTRTQMWRTVLQHRQDEEVPVYVTFADEAPVVAALAEFSRHTRGRFGPREKAITTSALAELGLNTPPTGDMGRIGDIGGTLEQMTAKLSASQRTACLQAARKITAGSGRTPPKADALALAETLFSSR
jgi:hypothetical protein